MAGGQNTLGFFEEPKGVGTRGVVYVDRLFVLEARESEARRVGSKNGHQWCHCWCSPGDEDTLHELARKIGMRREWFQDHRADFPHYDLTPSRRAAALKHGAIERSLHDWLKEQRAKRSAVVHGSSAAADRTTPEHVTQLAPNEVFCFGSNDTGRHGKGAALTARYLFGARLGCGRGPTGRCYAIATKGDADWQLFVHPISEIRSQVESFVAYARQRPEQRFLVTAIGCGRSKYTAREIAPLFVEAVDLPNVCLPASFWNVLSDFAS